MTWKIGKIELPIAPHTIILRYPRSVKKLTILEAAPWLLDYGSDVAILKLKGHIAESTKTPDQLEDDYLIPFADMAKRPAGVFPAILGDDDMVGGGNWAGIGWGSGSLLAATVSDSTTQVAKGTNSLKAIVATNGGTNKYSGAQRSWTTAEDWSDFDFVTFWGYGLGTGKFGVELYDDTTAKTCEVTDVAGWLRFLIRLEDFTNVDTSNITRIRVGRTTAGTTYFDRICVGMGQYVEAPGDRYDGIYIIKLFSFTEEKGVRTAFPYEFELWSSDQFY